MAIRYSGDVEIRIRYDRGSYYAKLRAPGLRANGSLPARLSLHTRKRPQSPEAYDQMAIAFLRMALSEGFPVLRENGRISIRRTFQAPCPYRV